MRHTLAPRTRIGQHFLIDDNIARKIVASIAPQPEDVLVEIGAGEGALTRLLVGTCRTLCAIEIDPRAIDVLRRTFGDRIDLIDGDALNVSLRTLAERHGARRVRVVGNIPYVITSPLLFHLFDEAEFVADAVLMMQREVADRLVAKPRTSAYGILSVMTQFHATPRALFTVAPTCFLPPPAVTSSVVSLVFADPAVDRSTRERVRRVVRTTFGTRRKTLHNGIRGLVSEAALESIGARFDLTRRPEELSVADFLALARLIEDHRA